MRVNLLPEPCHVCGPVCRPKFHDWPCGYPGCDVRNLTLGRSRCERHRRVEQLELMTDSGSELL